jgi:hypothetical protein
MTDRITTPGDGTDEEGVPGEIRGHAAADRWRGPLDDLWVVVGIYAVLGLLCGVAWWLLVDLPAFTVSDDGGAVMGELEQVKQFNGDAWFTVIAAVVGGVSGALITRWRARDFRLTTVLVVVGAFVAAWLTSLVGGWLGPGPAEEALAAASPGDRIPVPLEVTTDAAYLIWPIAALVGALVVLWWPPKET